MDGYIEDPALLAEGKALRAATEAEVVALYPSLTPATVHGLGLDGLRRMVAAAYRRAQR